MPPRPVTKPRAPKAEESRQTARPSQAPRVAANRGVRHDSGRYSTRRDNAPHAMRFLDEDGVFAIAVRSPRKRSLIAQYFSALSTYFGSTGDPSALAEFEGESILVDGKRYAFVTDLDVLERLGYAGELEFEELYANTV